MAAGGGEISEELKRTVYVGNIDNTALDRNGFKSLFNRFGTVTNLIHRETKYKRWFAFVTFSTEKSAKAAIKAAKSKRGVRYAGRRLWISPKENRSTNKRWTNKDVIGPNLIDKLDMDCMLYIFSFLHVKDKLNCEEVCIKWRELSLHMWSTAKEMSFSPDGVNIDKASEILKRMTGALKTLYFHREYSVGEKQELLGLVPPSVTHFTFYRNDILSTKYLSAAAAALPNLKAVQLAVGSYSLFADKIDETRLIEQLETHFPNIEDLSVSGRLLSLIHTFKSSLRKLSILDIYAHDAMYVQSIIDCLGKNLEELNIDKTCSLDSLEELKLKCPKLKKFSCCASSEYSVDFSGAPLLEELKVKHSEVILSDTEQLANLVTSCPGLKKLIFHGGRDGYLYSTATYDMLSSLPSLTHLVMCCSGYETVEIESLINIKKLETLRLRVPGGIRREELIAVINGLPYLKLLDISGQNCGISDVKENMADAGYIEDICKECICSDNRPTIELLIGGGGIKSEKWRWRCGRFIINNLEVEDEYFDDFESDGSGVLYPEDLYSIYDDSDDGYMFGYDPGDDDFDYVYDRYNDSDDDPFFNW